MVGGESVDESSANMILIFELMSCERIFLTECLLGLFIHGIMGGK